MAQPTRPSPTLTFKASTCQRRTCVGPRLVDVVPVKQVSACPTTPRRNKVTGQECAQHRCKISRRGNAENEAAGTAAGDVTATLAAAAALCTRAREAAKRALEVRYGVREGGMRSAVQYRVKGEGWLPLSLTWPWVGGIPGAAGRGCRNRAGWRTPPPRPQTPSCRCACPASGRWTRCGWVRSRTTCRVSARSSAGAAPMASRCIWCRRSGREEVVVQYIN